MRQSVAVLNPSLYEGFALTVGEATALGKAVIASDLPAHREHGTEGLRLFPPGDAAALAEVIADAWRVLPAGPAAEEGRAAVMADDRCRNGGISFARVVSGLFSPASE
jgi:glycosyltransferase involved in cell wall biosynthesis